MAGHRDRPVEASALAADPDPAVRVAALGALDRLGALGAESLVQAMSDPQPAVRRRACVLAGRHAWRRPDAGATSDEGYAAVVAGITRALSDEDDLVVEAAAFSLGELRPEGGCAAVDALCRLARSHASALCREAAVAALGAIGATSALPVVLAALEDTVYVRRRATVALVAFDDPRADAGLRRCLTDRDWQVRQAAEELLEDP